MVFDSPIYYWAWLGTFYLLWMTYDDVRHRMWVDDRKNWFMLGLSLSLYSHFHYAWWYVVIVLAVSMGLPFFLRWRKVFGDADVNGLRWLFLGFAIVGPEAIAFFALVFVGLSLAYYITKKALRISSLVPTPFFPVYAFAFVFCCYFLGLY